MKLILYHYWRSSCSWRVRWALAIKGIACEFVAVDLLKGEQRSTAHLQRNPAGTVPVLEVDGAFLTDSLAIIEWLEEKHPKPALLPKDPVARTRSRALANLVAAGIQPLQNLKVMKRVSDDPAKQNAWNRHWITEGLTAYETLAQKSAGRFSVGDQVSVADFCLIPQCYNALRFDLALNPFPTIARIYKAALATPVCQTAHPDRFKPD